MKVHIAGLAVLLSERHGRQRCAWCGHVLFDVDLANIAVAPEADGSPGHAPRPWQMGALVACEGNGMWVVPDPDPNSELPPEFCGAPERTRHLRLVE